MYIAGRGRGCGDGAGRGEGNTGPCKQSRSRSLIGSFRLVALSASSALPSSVARSQAPEKQNVHADVTADILAAGIYHRLRYRPALKLGNISIDRLPHHTLESSFSHSQQSKAFQLEYIPGAPPRDNKDVPITKRYAKRNFSVALPCVIPWENSAALTSQEGMGAFGCGRNQTTPVEVSGFRSRRSGPA